MIKVATEVQRGRTRFGVAVQVGSVQRALSLVGGRFPGRPCRVKAIEAEGLFIGGAFAREEMVQQPLKPAA